MQKTLWKYSAQDDSRKKSWKMVHINLISLCVKNIK